MVDPATLAGPVDGVLITKGSLFFLPPPSSPFTMQKARGSEEGSATRRVTLFGAKQSGNGSIDRIHLALVTGSLTSFSPLTRWREEGKERKILWLVFPTIMRGESSSFPLFFSFHSNRIIDPHPNEVFRRFYSGLIYRVNESRILQRRENGFIYSVTVVELLLLRYIR